MLTGNISNAKRRLSESELIINPDGSIFHLKLRPEHVAKDIIVVGDPGRVETISKRFQKVEFKIQNREFITHTGIYNNKRVTALATGIGTDNIDIVLNELDALVNIDLEKREEKEELTALNIVRIGTSGSLQEDLDVDSFIMSEYGLGFDGLLHYYNYMSSEKEIEILKAFLTHSSWSGKMAEPYLVKSSDYLVKKLGEGIEKGITATASGFYGPQGRMLRLPLAVPDLNETLTSFNSHGKRITNFEMETSALYGLSNMLGHNACTVCAIIANRIAKKYSKDYKVTVEKLIDVVLERLTA